MMWHYMLFGSADLTDTGESLIGYCRENRRVCPQPPLWNEFWPPLPKYWRRGTPRLRFQRCCGGKSIFSGLIEKAARFLRQLPEHGWNHLGEWSP
jgi:hypothetical protein